MAGIESVKILFSGDKLLENVSDSADFKNESTQLVFVNISINNETICRCFQALFGITYFQAGNASFTIIVYPSVITIRNTSWDSIHIKSVAVF